MSSSTSKMPVIAPRQTMRGHTDWVNGGVHLAGDRHIITCSSDGSLRLWDPESGIQIGEDWRHENNEGLRYMALSPNGKTIASGSNDWKVRLWDVETKKVITTWTRHTSVVCALCWSADSERVVSGSWDGTARVWDVDSGKTDSLQLATGGDREHAAKIWDAKTGELLNTLKHDSMVCSLAWTSDGKKLISGSNDPIRIFDTATWQQLAILEGHANSLSTPPRNNRLLASASTDSTARLWNLDTNLPVGPPLQHEDVLRSATFSADGKVLVTACENKNVYTWDVHAILKEAGFEDLLSIGTDIAPKDRLKQKASQDDSGIQHTSRSSLSDKSFLEADATPYPGQFDGVDELSPTFFNGMEADVDSFPMGDARPHSLANALLARFFSLLHRFRPNTRETTELLQPSRPSAFHPHALLAHLTSLTHRSPPENDAPDKFQQPSTPPRLDPHVLLARFSHFPPRSRLGTNEEAEPHPTTSLSSRPDPLISRLSSLFRSQPRTNEEIELPQRPSCPRIVEVAAVRDRQALVVARRPEYEKAKREHQQQTQSHGQAQASSSHTQPADASTSATPPAPGANTTTAGTAVAQSPPIPWWAQIVLFLCCASPPHANGH